MRLYDYWESGNAYKVRLLLHQLERRYERVHLDILKGETRTPAFLAKNPNGRIPLLELDDGRTLAESNAIQWYLAQGTPFLPDDPFEQAQVLQWCGFEQYSHEPNVAVLRFWHFSGRIGDHTPEEIAEKTAGSHAALAVMEGHLADRAFFVGERYSIADIALYAYTHVAPEGKILLDDYPAIRAWLERVRAEPRHVAIDHERPTR